MSEEIKPSDERPKCALCGEPMPVGEEMFKYHGYSGDCPKPPLPRETIKTRTIQDAVSEAQALIDNTLAMSNPSNDRDAWFIRRLTKIDEALANRA